MVLESRRFFPYTANIKTDVLSALQVWLQRPRGIASDREGFRNVVSQPAVERDA